MKKLNLLTIAALCSSCVLFSQSVTLAGEANKLYIKQDGVGNSLDIDQSAANNSQIGGIELTGLTTANNLYADVTNSLQFSQAASPTLAPVFQSGGNNNAEIVISDSSGNASAYSSVYLFQDNSDPLASANAANINISSQASFAGVRQVGTNNEANVSITGDFSKGAVLQQGDGNIGSVVVSGLSSEGILAQNANGSNTSLVVVGAGTTVNYTLNSAVPVAATGEFVVTTNAANVNVTITTNQLFAANLTN